MTLNVDKIVHTKIVCALCDGFGPFDNKWPKFSVSKFIIKLGIKI